MSALRQRLRRPETYLAALALLVVAGVADSLLAPRYQTTARIYVMGVRGYQWVLRPVLSKFIACRYVPTCSEYSIQAVERHGIRKGLLLTRHRIDSCQRGVPMGTVDRVPAGP